MSNTLFDTAEVVDFFDCLTPEEQQRATFKAEIAVAIFRKRHEMGMSQAEFAAYMGVNQSTISKWESGDYNFSLDRLAAPLSKLNLTLKVVPVPDIYAESNCKQGYSTMNVSHAPKTWNQAAKSFQKHWTAPIFLEPTEQYLIPSNATI